jgi:AcrR family transcriptional regulator
MDEIASALHISKKTIYKHFPSKENLLDEIIISEIELSNAIIKKIIDSDSDVIKKFVDILEFYLSKVSKFSEKWLRDVQIHTPDLWCKLDKFRTEKIHSGLIKLLNQGKKEKLILDIPPEIIILAHTTTMRAISNPEFINQCNISVKRLLHTSFEMLINGILTDKGRKEYKKLIKSKVNIKNNFTY